MSAVLKARFPEKLAILSRPSRYKVLYGGRGGSKSWGVARALLIDGAQRQLRILCAREVQRTIADSVHKLLSDQIVKLGMDSWYRVKESEIVGRNGTEFSFAGLRHQTVANLKSFEGVDRCWVEEAQAVSKKSWDILIPTIRKEDSEIWITFNPELDTDETYKRFIVNPPPGTLTEFLTWRDNPWFPDVLDRERIHLQKTDPEAYENVWEGKCRSAVEGAIYHNEVRDAIENKRVRPVPYDPSLKVHTIWDLGWNDQTSIILVQKAQSELRLIGYIEDSHRTLHDYVADLEAKRLNWGKDYLPHDGEAKSLQTGASPKDILRRLGRKVEIVPRTNVELGIKAARGIFHQCFFDETECERLLACLKRYRRSVNVATQEPGAPLHDEYSHGADAFRGLALVAPALSNDDTNFYRKIVYDDAGIV